MLFIHVACLRMRVLFYFYLYCIHVCAYAFKFKVPPVTYSWINSRKFSPMRWWRSVASERCASTPRSFEFVVD